MDEIEGKPKQKNEVTGSGKRPAWEFLMKNRELVGSIKKNFMETLKVHVFRYQGKVYVDARIFVNDASDPEVVIATKKGLCLRPEVVKELLPILAEAQAKAEKARPRDDSDD
jgi:hypothetical protein